MIEIITLRNISSRVCFCLLSFSFFATCAAAMLRFEDNVFKCSRCCECDALEPNVGALCSDPTRSCEWPHLSASASGHWVGITNN